MSKVRIPVALAATLVLALAVVPSVSAAAPPRGLAPANAHVLGYSLQDLAGAYMHWIIDAPNQATDCGPSQLDSRIWFLAEVTSEGGVPNVDCSVPAGSFLVIVPAFWECSSLEDLPFHAENEAELIACVDAGFANIATVAITLDGRTSTDLAQYATRTRVLDIGPDNIFGPDPGISMTEGYFAVIHPLSRGVHHARIDATYPDFGFEGLTDYTITVG